jgi:hypothetical protein
VVSVEHDGLTTHLVPASRPGARSG